LLALEIGVEDHGEVANEDAAEPGGGDLLGFESDKAVLDGGSEGLEFVGEVLVEIDLEFAGDFVLEDDGVAEQAGDDGAAKAVVVGKVIAAHGGDAALGDGFFPVGNVAVILGVGVLDARDGGDAHAIEVGAGFGGVALKIAVESAILLGTGEFVAGFGEVVHADVEVSGLDEFEQAGAENFELGHAFGEMTGEGALLLFEPGDVGVREEGDAVGSEFKDLIHGVSEGFRSLVGETVDKVNVDGLKAEFAGRDNEIAG